MFKNIDDSTGKGDRMFFAPGTQIDRADVFPMFGWRHIALLIIVALCLFLAIHYVAHAPQKQAKRIIRVAAVAVPVLELSHTVWLYLCGFTDFIKLLPLHLCAMQSIFIPLAVFTRKTYFKEFVYATAVLGGALGILFPAGVAECYPVWHYQTIQTAVLHGLLIFVPLALIFSGEFRPELRNFSKVLLIFLCVALVAAAVDFGFGENYMFLRQAPEGTPLVWIYDTFGRGTYLVVTFLILASASISMYWPFTKRGRQIAAQRAVERKHNKERV